MRVKAIMIPIDKLTCIQVEESLKKAMEVIDENNLLSLPVIKEKQFIGVLSKQYTYEYFFKEYTKSREDFLNEPVAAMMKSKVDSVQENAQIEEAAALFISSKVRFVPVINEENEFVGIVTQQAVFKQYQGMFGEKHNSFVIYTYDYKGVGAKIMETISKAGGNIRNLIVSHPDVMDLVEIFIRIDAPDFEKVLKALKKQNFDVRDIKYSK